MLSSFLWFFRINIYEIIKVLELVKFAALKYSDLLDFSDVDDDCDPKTTTDNNNNIVFCSLQFLLIVNNHVTFILSSVGFLFSPSPFITSCISHPTPLPVSSPLCGGVGTSCCFDQSSAPYIWDGTHTHTHTHCLWSVRR